MDTQTSLSNSQNRYNYISEDNGYHFQTDEGNVYHISFCKLSELFDDLPFVVYSFNIERDLKAEKHSNGDTNKVRNTVIDILKRFFSENFNAIITICDVTDSLQYCRKRLFDRWFNSFSDGKICMVSDIVKMGDKDTYASLYFNNHMIYSDELIKRFNDFVTLISYAE